MEKKKYFAFISYSHKDSELSKWLQHEFEYYELPATLFDERTDLRKEDFPESFKPVFRDEDELAGGELKPQISEALADSEYLIVVCSPHSAQSLYVDNEIKEFISLSQENKRRIFPFIVDGKPHQDKEHKDKECFPRTLLELSKDKTDPIEIIAGDIHATGRDHAFVKILAGTLKEKHIRFADLWDRYALEKAEQERKGREEKEKLQIVQSQFLAEKANALVSEGDSYTAMLLALEALPNNLQDPERPYVAEAEASLRNAHCYHPNNSCARIYSGSNSSVGCVSFSPDGKSVAASTTCFIKMWDVMSGAILRQFPENKYGITAMSFSPDGELIISGDSRGFVCMWDVSTESLLHKEKVGDNWINDIKYDFDGKHIAICAGTSIIVLETDTYSRFLPTLHHNQNVNSVSFSHDGEQIISASADNIIKVWDAQTGVELNSYNYKEYHKETIECVASSPNDELILTASYDGLIVIRDIKSNTILHKLHHDAPIESAMFYKDEKHIVSAERGKAVKIWNLENETYDKYRYPVNVKGSISINEDGNFIALGSNWDIRLINLENNLKPITCKIHSGDVSSFASFSPDGEIVVSVENKYGKLQTWETKTGKLLKSNYTGHKKFIQSVFFSPEGNYILTSSYDGKIKIWDAQSLSYLFELEGEYLNEHSAVMTKKNEFILTASGKYAKLWNMKKECIKTFGNGSASINSAFFDKSESFVVTSNGDGKIRIWDITTEKGEKILGEDDGHSKPVNYAVFSPDGNLVASASSDCTIKIWDVNSCKCLNTLQGHHNAVETVSFNSDGKLLISASIDNTIKIWDVETGVLLDTLTGHESTVTSAFFNKDYKIVSSSWDGTIKIWIWLSRESLIEKVKSRFSNRLLTLEEKKRFHLE